MSSILQKLWQKLRQVCSPPSGAQSRPQAIRPQFQRTGPAPTQSYSQGRRVEPRHESAQPQTQQTSHKTQVGWTKKQRIRLAVEDKILASKASGFHFHEHTRADKTYVAGKVKTSDGHKYELKVLLGSKFPDEMPSLLLVSPNAAKYDGGLIVDEGLSHRFHSRGKGAGGHLELCHCNESTWDPHRTILSILIKGAIWSEAHSRHLKTGKSIAEYCDELKDQVPDLKDY
jgi:hypothetical protein